MHYNESDERVRAMENQLYEDLRNIAKDSNLKEWSQSRGDYLAGSLVSIVAIG